MRPVALTRRDHAILRGVWSLGWATSRVLTALVAPTTAVKTLAGRLAELTNAGYLTRRRMVAGPGGHVWLYGLGPNARRVDPAYGRPWRPTDAQIGHTVAITNTLAALVTPGRLGALTVIEWTGEAELRAWHRPGDAIPDLVIRWQGRRTEGTWAVEVDRGTQARGAWRRKLVRYLDTTYDALLVVTTSDQRARNLARLGRGAGARLLTVDHEGLHATPVHVYDAVKGCRRSVDDAAN